MSDKCILAIYSETLLDSGSYIWVSDHYVLDEVAVLVRHLRKGTTLRLSIGEHKCKWVYMVTGKEGRSNYEYIVDLLSERGIKVSSLYLRGTTALEYVRREVPEYRFAWEVVGEGVGGFEESRLVVRDEDGKFVCEL